MLSPDGASTTGKVVFRDALIELIQYSPTTAWVGPQPVLIVPSWRKTLTVQDFSPSPALVGWLVAQGNTVFAIVWRNLDARVGGAALEDDRAACVRAAFDVVGLICVNAKIHAAGYGLGGTLLSLVSSVMAHDADDCLASVSLFASQTEFDARGLARSIAEEKRSSRHYGSRIAVGPDTLSPPTWEQDIAPLDASWWPQWTAWLARNAGPPMEPPPMDFALGDAPGDSALGS